MKKHLLLGLIAACTTTAPALAQELDTQKPSSPIRRGNLVIGSGLGLGKLSVNDGPGERHLIDYDVRLSPSVGVFISDHWLLSAAVSGSISQETRWINEHFRHNMKSVGVGISARHYFGKSLHADGSLNRLRFFAEGGLSAGRTWTKYTQVDQGLSGRTARFYGTVDIGAGVNYLLNSNVALEGGLNYNRMFPRHNTGFDGPSSLNMNLGVRIFLNKR